MFGRELGIPVEVGNLLLWIWLEVSVLAAMIQCTSILAKIIVRDRLRAGTWVRLRKKKTVLDRLPCNSDLRALSTGPKLFLTLIRILFMVLVAVSGIGIDAGRVFSEWQPTTHVLQLNDRAFKGRAFNETATDAIQDISVVGCEDINSKSLEKYQAFISPTFFSCNDGRKVGARKRLVEVLWDKEQVRQISSGKAKPPKVIRGENSCISAEKSSANMLVLTVCNEYPDFMYVGRREAPEIAPGSCEYGKPREYLIVSNNPDFIISLNNVTVAYVLCEKEHTVFMRNTDQVLLLPTQGAAQQSHLARRVANSLVSIVPDKSRRAYFGKIRRVTSIVMGYDYMMVAMSALNILLFIAVWMYHRTTKDESDVDPFSPHSMFMLADSYHRDFHRSDERGFQDVLIKNTGSRDKWNIVATIDNGQNLMNE